MKISIERDKIVKAVKKLEGIEIVLEDADDAKEALNLVFEKADVFDKEDYKKFKDVKVISSQRYETSAVEYKMTFILEFLFEDNTPLDTRISLIKQLQEFFRKA